MSHAISLFQIFWVSWFYDISLLSCHRDLGRSLPRLCLSGLRRTHYQETRLPVTRLWLHHWYHYSFGESGQRLVALSFWVSVAGGRLKRSCEANIFVCPKNKPSSVLIIINSGNAMAGQCRLSLGNCTLFILQYQVIRETGETTNTGMTPLGKIDLGTQNLH